MRFKLNPRGHRLAIGEVRTQDYTDVGWRNVERTCMLLATRLTDPAFRLLRRIQRRPFRPAAIRTP